MSPAASDPFALPPEFAERIAAVGRAADHILGKDPEAALTVSREEYELYLAAESVSGRRLHKGHALHNIGVAIHARDPEEGRAYFHAAHIEDARTFPGGSEEHGWLARQMLLNLYGERLSLIEQVEALARWSNDEPVGLARRFAAERGTFEEFHGITEGWRSESELDQFSSDQLVFCGGSRALPMGFKALAAGAEAANLQPVVVMEFENRPGELPYKKSLRLLDRCRLAAFDISDPQGQIEEMTVAERSGTPIFAAFVSNDPLDKQHGSSMHMGLVDAAGTKARACRGYDEMEAEVRDWCRAQPPVLPIPFVAPLRQRRSFLEGSNFRAAGSAFPSQRVLPSGSDAAAFLSEAFEGPEPSVNFRGRGSPATADVLVFDRDGLTAAGFAGWESVAQLGSKIAQVPLSAGTYVVLGPGGTPRVLPVNRGGRFRGKDPTVAVAVLEARLLAETPLLYVGQGGSLRKRIRQLIQFASGKPVGHWGGRCLWQLEDSDEFLIAWRVETSARQAEAKLLDRFEVRYGRLPFANWQR